MKWFRSRSADGPAGASSEGGVLADPPRHATLRVVRCERVELRDQAGIVLAWTRADRALSSVHDGGGRPILTFRPGVKQMFTATNMATLAVEGAIFGGDVAPRQIGPRSPAAPPLGLRDMRGGFDFGQIELGDDRRALVALLPPGRLNDRLLERKLGASEVSRIRLRSPLAYLPDLNGVDELRDASGGIVARVRLDGGPQDGTGAEPCSLDVEDNDLPAAWLFAIVLGCLHWGR